MSRPEKVEDLEEYERSAHEFVKVDLQHLTIDVTVGAAVLALIDAARKSQAFEVGEDGEFVIKVPLSQSEIEARVKRAQSTWDSNRDGYEQAVLDAGAIPGWRRFSIDQWAKREERVAIDWPALEAVA